MTDLTSKIKLAHPVVGCTGTCEYCYAKKINMEHWYNKQGWENPLLLENWEEELTSEVPAVFMVTGMSDLADWQQSWITQVWNYIEKHPEHQFLFLTKRPEDIHIQWDMSNIWIGVSITKKEELSKIDSLRELSFNNKFVAFEPLLEDLGQINLDNISWISIGKELGDRPDRVVPSHMWIRSIVKQFNGPVLMKSSLRYMMGTEFKQQLPSSLENIVLDSSVNEDYIEVLRKVGKYENS